MKLFFVIFLAIVAAEYVSGYLPRVGTGSGG